MCLFFNFVFSWLNSIAYIVISSTTHLVLSDC
nr:MAG TPA: hypothetical protein [Caudoviricetes sp.]